ncbi:MAG: phenylalanine--tRNA ligase subunit beta, partial [Clostridiales bacterium]|nr:phenylalanine--tRNA ligase subunit beta [Clostridiales bacterium]
SGAGEDFYTVKGVVETILDVFGIEASYMRSGEPFLHPGRSADAYSDGKKIASFGEVHPEVLKNYNLKDAKVCVAEIDSDYIVKNAVVIRKFRAASKYPSVTRDLSLIMDDKTDAGIAVDLIRYYAGELLEKVNVFDVFKGNQIPKGKKSLALSMVFQSYDRTLNDKEINALTEKILLGLETHDIYIRK